ncbi:DNA recombination protein RmuC [bacterium]|nr:DNA recombination protein RmuC [bacterium]
MEILVTLVAGVAIGFTVAWFVFGRSKGVPRDQYEGLLKEKTDLSDKVLELVKDVSRLEAEKQGLLEKLEAGTADFENLQQKFEDRFKILAHEILDDQSKKFQATGEKSIQSIIDPLKERLLELQENVTETKTLNKDMTKETKSLVIALRGDSATQGRWGELVLNQILERSGLREGEEYTVQGKGLGLKGAEGETQKPDVIINIPDPEKPKHVIIDSKVSLNAYDAYLNTANSEEKQKYLKDFLLSLRKHISDLSGKKYDHNEKLNSPDFVLMFVPLEGAFALAMQSDKDIFPEAWDKNIVIVSPTTLLCTLRTVAALWSHERISRNVMKIAEQAGGLYDKFVSFLSDLGTIGDKLKGAQSSYDEAIKKISTGRGNLIDKVESIKGLGAKAYKQIDQKYLLESKEESGKSEPEIE